MRSLFPLFVLLAGLPAATEAQPVAITEGHLFGVPGFASLRVPRQDSGLFGSTLGDGAAASGPAGGHRHRQGDRRDHGPPHLGGADLHRSARSGRHLRRQRPLPAGRRTGRDAHAHGATHRLRDRQCRGGGGVRGDGRPRFPALRTGRGHGRDRGHGCPRRDPQEGGRQLGSNRGQLPDHRRRSRRHRPGRAPRAGAGREHDGRRPGEPGAAHPHPRGVDVLAVGQSTHLHRRGPGQQHRDHGLHVRQQRRRAWDPDHAGPRADREDRGAEGARRGDAVRHGGLARRDQHHHEAWPGGWREGRHDGPPGPELHRRPIEARGLRELLDKPVRRGQLDQHGPAPGGPGAVRLLGRSGPGVQRDGERWLTRHAVLLLRLVPARGWRRLLELGEEAQRALEHRFAAHARTWASR